MERDFTHKWQDPTKITTKHYQRKSRKYKEKENDKKYLAI